MTENKHSEYFDDFEIITELQTAFPRQNESENMDTNSEAEMSAQDKPTPKPRTRGSKDSDIHSTREVQWLKEKEKLLNLNASMKQNEQELKSEYEEVVNTLENEKEVLQSKCKELDAELVSEKERACKIIEELQEKRKETTEESQVRIQELENEVDNTRKLYEEALERIQVFEQKESESEQHIQRLEEDLENIKQKNDLAKHKINELESTNMRIQEHRAEHDETLAKQKELYAELSGINDEMEKELHENKTKVRELTTKLQENTRENKQILQEKAEMKRQFEIRDEDIEKQMEKLNNNAREIQIEKDQLESELVTMKLVQKRLTTEMQEAKNMATKSIEERDFSDKKCKELEKGIKLNADTEITQLNQALEALNEENNVLRQRNIKLEGEVGILRNVNSDLEAKVKRGNLGEENGGFVSERSQDKPIRQKKPERMDKSTVGTASTPTNTSDEQWYESDEGSPLFAQIYGELNSKFSKVEINRTKSTKDIELSVTTDQRRQFKIHFPRNFPFAAVTVDYHGASKEMKVPFNRNAPTELAKELSKMLCVLVYGQAPVERHN